MIATREIKVTLTQEEYELLEVFAAEQGIEKLEEAMPALLHELVKVYDKLWEVTFANSLDVVAKLAQEASDDYHAGRIEDFESESR
jgi:hypothetical protein